MKMQWAILGAVALAGCGGGDCPAGSVSDDGRCVVDCAGAEDGMTCSTGICLNEVCQAPRCGDAVVTSPEECDDANARGDDGCEPDCTLTCTMAAHCDDGDVCNGEEACEENVCAAGTAPPDRTECSAVSGAGLCLSGLCVAAGCGNGVVESGEDCDDMNTDNEDGCKLDCTFTCTAAADCSDGEPCNGEEMCDLETHQCGDGPELDCNDEDICTDDACEEGVGCVNTLIDEDGDGFAAALTCTTEGLEGGDCHDGLDTVHPGQTTFFDEGYCPPALTCPPAALVFDYNCDGRGAEELLAVGGRCTGFAGMCMGPRVRWLSAPVPGCGQTADARGCGMGLMGGCEFGPPTPTVQGCR